MVGEIIELNAGYKRLLQGKYASHTGMLGLRLNI
jgi:hypothetical protein